MKLKGVHRLNASITRAVNKTAHIKLPCFLSAEFALYPEDEFINYTIIETERTQRTFRALIEKLGGDCDSPYKLFAYSLLHEVGHYYTLDDIPDFVYNFSRALEKILTVLNRIFKHSDFIYSLYYYIPHEIIATKWAINHTDYVYKMEKDISKAFEIFLEENNFSS